MQDCGAFRGRSPVDRSAAGVPWRGIEDRKGGATRTCVECGAELLAERVELGYDYCTKKECQMPRRRGLTVTAVGVNKSADVLLVADETEVRRRGEAGEFGRKNTTLGMDYRPIGPASPVPAPRRPTRAPVSPRQTPAWSRQQEQIVRLYHEMGLNPRQIVDRARSNAPRLALTEGLVTRILTAPRRDR